jgi:hypothetical protein
MGVSGPYRVIFISKADKEIWTMDTIPVTIEKRSSYEVKFKPMLKKIEKILEKEGPYFTEKEHMNKLMGLPSEDYESDMDKRTGKLVHFYTSELLAASLQLEREQTDLDRRILQQQRNNREVEKSDLEHFTLLNMQLRILDNAITKKKQYKKDSNKHPLENTLVHYPFISASSPTEETLVKMREDGKIVQYRDGGYRRLHYKNDRGKHLTVYDERTLLGIGSLWLKRDRKPSFTFDFKELAAEMYIMEPTGADYTAILNSLNNLYATSCVTEEFMDPNGVIRESIKFVHLFAEFQLHGKQGRERAVTIQIADFIQRNMLAGNYVNVNLFVFNDFQNNATKALYPLVLSMLSEYREEYMIPIDQLIHHCNINDDNHSKARSIIMKAFEELASSDIVSEPVERNFGDKYVLYFKRPVIKYLQIGDTDEAH